MLLLYERAVRAGGCGGLADFHGGQLAEVGLERVVDPVGDVLAGGAVGLQRVVKVVMVEVRLEHLFHRARDVGKVGHHVALAPVGDEMRAPQLDREDVRMPVEIRALAVVMHQLMRGFKVETFPQLKHIQYTTTKAKKVREDRYIFMYAGFRIF